MADTAYRTEAYWSRQHWSDLTEYDRRYLRMEYRHLRHLGIDRRHAHYIVNGYAAHLDTSNMLAATRAIRGVVEHLLEHAED